MGKISTYASQVGIAITDYLLGNAASGPTTKRFLISELSKTLGIRGGFHNVLDYGALGDANHTIGGGSDDTAEIQAAYDAAAASGGTGVVIFPGRHTYRISATINIPTGVYTIGHGGLAGGGSGSPPIIVWDGADNGIMLLVSPTSDNVFHTHFQNINLYGVTSSPITNKPLTGIKIIGSGGATARTDTGTGLVDVLIQGMNSHALHLADGATNFFIDRGRFDTNLGYGIYVNLNGTNGTFTGAIYGNTNWTGGNRGQGKGFLFLDGETAPEGSAAFLTISGLHTEVNQDLDETFAAGANPYDKRGIIRLGVKPSLGILQHQLSINGWRNSFASGPSFSAIQITATSGTTATASDCAYVDILNGHALHSFNIGDSQTNDEVRLFGGMVPAARRWPYKSFEHGHITWGYGKDADGAGLRSFVSHRHGAYAFRGLTLLPETVAALESFPATGGLAYVTDATSTTLGSTVAGGGSNKVLVFNNGSAWKIISVVN